MIGQILKIVSWLAPFILIGCAAQTGGQVARTAQFEASNATSLVVVNLQYTGVRSNPYLVFRELNPDVPFKERKVTQVGRSNMADSGGDKFLSYMTGGQTDKDSDFFVFEVDPGDWYLHFISSETVGQLRNGRCTIYLGEKTIGFSAEAGQALYLGSFRFKSGRNGGCSTTSPLVALDDDLSAAAEFLENYEDVTVSLEKAKVFEVRSAI